MADVFLSKIYLFSKDEQYQNTTAIYVHSGEPHRSVLAYGHKCCVLAVLNAACVHILIANKHIWVYIIVIT